MAELRVLRVFVNEEGEWGNRLGVVLDGDAVPEAERGRLAAELGFSETVFVTDATSGRLRVHAPAVELPFAGHPLVGTAWLLRRQGFGLRELRPPAGAVGVRVEGEKAYVAAPPAWSPPFEHRRLGSPAAVRALAGPPERGRNVYAWAWIDEEAGTLRARSFVPEAGIEEDEATGSAALALCAELERPITVHQGRGSVLNARPLAGGRVEVGGLVSLDETRRLPI